MNTPQHPATDSPPSAMPTKRGRRFRFSLMTLVLIAALIGLAVSHLRTSLLLFDANRELRRFRTELGYLHVTDRSRIHAIAVPRTEISFGNGGYICRRGRSTSCTRR